MKLTVTFQRTLPNSDVVQKQADITVTAVDDLTDVERVKLLKACGRGLLQLSGATVALTREETVVTTLDVNAP